MKVTNFIKTGKSVVVVLDEGAPITVPDTFSEYKKVMRLIDEGKYDEVLGVVNITIGLETKSKGRFKMVGDTVVYHNGETLPTSLSNRLLQLIKHGAPTESLEKFWQNLRQNPSEESVSNLYEFLERHHVPITPDGSFVCYKAVRKDFTDKRTGTFDNTPGNIVKMKSRAEVDPDRKRDCSYGLHVAAYNYAKNSYGGSADIVIEVLVNPKDVVAVPEDYDCQKMRVVKYTVIRVCKQQISERTQTYTGASQKAKKAAKKIAAEREPVVPMSQSLSLNKRNQLRIPAELLRWIGRSGNTQVHVCQTSRSAETLRVCMKSKSAYHKTTPYKGEDILISRTVLDWVGKSFSVYNIKAETKEDEDGRFIRLKFS